MPASARFAAVNPQISLAALHDRMIVFAQDEQGALVHVDAARRGKACHCLCLACGEALIARQGDVKAHSFAHASGTECQFAVDAMLNRLAQELIGAAGVFVTPPLVVRSAAAGPHGMIRQEQRLAACRLRVESVRLDRRAHRQRPSVVMAINGRELLLEVTYGHQLDAHKRGAIEKLGLAAVELHIEPGMAGTVEQLGRQLLQEADGKRWIFNPKAHAIQLRLDALVGDELLRQTAQQARALEAARAAQALLRQQALKAAVEEQWQAREQRDRMRRQARARPPEAAPAARPAPASASAPAGPPTLLYCLRDGGVRLQHAPDGVIVLLPETGNEAVLQAFAGLGLPYSAERGGYLAPPDRMEEIVLALRPYQLSVRSV